MGANFSEIRKILKANISGKYVWKCRLQNAGQCFSAHNLLSGEPDYFGRNKISSGGDLSHYSSASLY